MGIELTTYKPYKIQPYSLNDSVFSWIHVYQGLGVRDTRIFAEALLDKCLW